MCSSCIVATIRCFGFEATITITPVTVKKCTLLLWAKVGKAPLTIHHP